MRDAQKLEVIRKISTRLFWSLLVLIPTLLIVALEPWRRNFTAQSEPIRPEPEMIYIVLGLGALGAFVSLQRRLKTLGADDLLLLSSSWFNAWLIPIVGGILATVLYCLFLSGLLSGDLFPGFCRAVIDKYKDPAMAASQPNGFWRLLECQGNEPRDYAKLFFWSFVAGFSEKFVVDIIGQFERRGPTSESEDVRALPATMPTNGKEVEF